MLHDRLPTQFDTTNWWRFVFLIFKLSVSNEIPKREKNARCLEFGMSTQSAWQDSHNSCHHKNYIYPVHTAGILSSGLAPLVKIRAHDEVDIFHNMTKTIFHFRVSSTHVFIGGSMFAYRRVEVY